MKNFIRKRLPHSLLDFYRRQKRAASHRKNASKSAEEVFTDIYETNKWGGESGDYCSGGGTVDARISKNYIDCIEALAKKHHFGELTAVDLGCGDMRIGAQIENCFARYTGVDVVKGLIASHNEEFGNERRSFVHVDIAEEELPAGDVCLIRQVLQHLSNAQIEKILTKAKKSYRFIIVTEHLPSPNPQLKMNLDKPHGGDIRIYENSGVYLTAPPFNVPAEQSEVVLEIKGHECENYEEPWMKGVIQTVVYQPN